MRVVLALLLVLAAAAGPAEAALRRPKPKGKCNCRVGGGIPAKFQPVCGADFVTYGNECVAKCANVLIRSNSRCPNCVLKFGNCQCGKGYSPKCSFGLTFSSTCDAACGGYTCPMSNGVCQTPLGTRSPRVSAKKTDVGAAARNTNLPSKSAARYSYTRAIHLSLIFFESMRSGKLDRQRLAWRSDSCLKCRGPSGENLSKGYYEAGGSFLKLGLVEAFLVTALSDSVLTFPTGFRKSGDLRNAIKAIEWGADYLIAAHSKPDRFVAVFGNDTIDFAAYSSPESRSAPRTSCYIDGRKRGSEIAGEAAAALAAASLVYKANKVKRDTKSMIVHSKQLYNLATKYPGSYASAGAKTCLGIHKRLYASANGYTDELAWAAAWLYRATGESRFRNDARKYYGQLKQPAYAYEFGVKTPGLNVLMQQIDPGNAGRYLNDARNFFSPYLNQNIQHTPAGLAYPYHFGALRPTTQASVNPHCPAAMPPQMAFLALKQSKILRSRKNNLGYAAQLFNYAAFQINYVLGDGGRSWLGGYDKTAPTYWWHKPSYNSYITNSFKGVNVYAGIRAQKTDGRIETLFYVPAAKFDFQGGYSPQRFTPYGALYGAPLGDDSLIKGRADYSYSEPTADGNAAVTGAFAALAEYFSNKQGAQSDCGLNLGWTHKAARLNSRSVNNTAICARRGL